MRYHISLGAYRISCIVVESYIQAHEFDEQVLIKQTPEWQEEAAIRCLISHSQSHNTEKLLEFTGILRLLVTGLQLNLVFSTFTAKPYVPSLIYYR